MSGRADFLAYRKALEHGQIDAELEIGAFAAVRAALERIETALRRMEYQFWCEDDPTAQGVSLRPLQSTPRDELARLMAFHERLRRVPYALRAMALHLGEVDFRQSPRQGKPAHLHSDATPVESLCEYDPVFFATRYAVRFITDYLADGQDTILEFQHFEFAPDAFHKADVSGGEGYFVDCQDHALDPVVPNAGMTFLQFLDETLARGGFFGALKSGTLDFIAPRVALPEPIGETLRQAAEWG